jgi:WD40 repeat protein
MKTTLRLLTSCFAAWLAFTFTSASAADLSSQKLFGKWSLTPTGYALGADFNAVALSPKWIAVGDAGAAERGQVLEGGVQVFNAATGAWVRKLLPPGVATANQRFGGAVAISGDILLIGAYSTDSNKGKAYLFNLATGALLRTFSASDGVANDFFGFNVALNPDYAVVSAYGDDSNKGSIYVYRVSTGAELIKIQAFDGVAGGYFGDGLAVEGSILAVGADGSNGNRGAIYFYDLNTLTLIKRVQPAAALIGSFSCYTLGMHQGRVVIGSFDTGKAYLYDLANDIHTPLIAPGSAASFGKTVAIYGPLVAVSESLSAQGKVHLFNSSTGAFLQTLTAPNGDATSSQRFGLAIALSGNTLLASAPDDSVQAINAGAAYLIKPLLRPLPYTKVVQKGDFAPGAVDISYGTLGDAFVSPDGEVLFASPLTGAGSNANKDIGVFTDVKTENSQEMVFKTRSIRSSGVSYGLPAMLALNDANVAIGVSSLTGTGISALNNQALWYKTNATSGILVETGSAFASTNLIGTTPLRLQEVVASNQLGEGGYATVCTLRVGLGGVTAASDSGLYYDRVFSSRGALGEGGLPAPPTPLASTRGQFTPRLAYNYNQMIYSTALTGTAPNVTTANNAAVFKMAHGDAETLVAQKGGTIVDDSGAPLAGATYSAFIGESGNGDDGCAYRATIAGPASLVTTATNEGIWLLKSTPSRKLAFRKGQSTALPSGVKIAKIVNFWAAGWSIASSSQCLALVQLSGTGVTSANDQALMLYQEDGTTTILLREGDPAPGCPEARIGLISRIEVDAWTSTYAVLATLTGATTSNDLALFTGTAYGRGNTTTQVALRRPVLRLRKGDSYDNQPSKVKSISLPTTSVTASGAGGTGRGRALNYSNTTGRSQFAFVVEFDNGVRQIVKGNGE